MAKTYEFKGKGRSMPRTKNPGNTSPFSHLIDQHYESLGLKKLWNERRIKRLVNFMRITKRDLASLVNMPYNIFIQMNNSGQVTGPAALMLTILEHQVMGDFAPDTVNVWKFPWST